MSDRKIITREQYANLAKSSVLHWPLWDDLPDADVPDPEPFSQRCPLGDYKDAYAHDYVELTAPLHLNATLFCTRCGRFV